MIDWSFRPMFKMGFFIEILNFEKSWILVLMCKVIKSASHLKQVIDEAYINPKNCKMTMMPPFTFGKNVMKKNSMEKLPVTLHSIM